MQQSTRTAEFRLSRFARLAKARQMAARAAGGEDGASLVEMAVSFTVLMTVLLGLIQVSFAFYLSHAINVGAREATRWAAVRGSSSCLILSTFPDCNYSPTGYGPGGTSYSSGTSNDPVEIFVRGMGYPGLSSATAQASWYTANMDSNGNTQWLNDACAGSTDEFGQPCNGIGHMVQVTVTYTLPFNLPFIGTQSLSMHSTSGMVINE